jgi:CheY-like chemotaxis protein/nitrogen-specific signal transduction histidine kinase
VTLGADSADRRRSDASEPSHLTEVRARLEEIVAAHEQTVQRERLTAYRKMASEAAHDFTETLSGILARAQNLLDDMPDPQVLRAAKMIEQVALEGARAARRFQEFGRAHPAHLLEAVDLNKLVGEVADSVCARWTEQLAASGISGEVHAETSYLPLVSGDAAELRHVLTSIADNALDAMPEGGNLTFRTGIVGPRVFCVVADTGVGIGDEVRPQIFDPFFTTKRAKGPGFGLGAVYAIMDRHGGEITVESEVGKGTTFTIWLSPAKLAELAPQPASEALPTMEPTSTPGARILVVDDAEEVREVLRELLTQHGHTVVTCEDGESGLAELETQRFDLAMVDVALPGISGLEVAKRLKGRWPDATVVVMTGYFDRLGPEGTLAKGVDFVLTKPFTLDQLRLVMQHAYSNAPA